jgi:hypothetical protein
MWRSRGLEPAELNWNFWSASQPDIVLRIKNIEMYILGYMTSSQHLSGIQLFLSKVLKLNNFLYIQYNSWSTKMWNCWLNVIVKTACNAEFFTVSNTL